jgi:MFS family permease
MAESRTGILALRLIPYYLAAVLGPFTGNAVLALTPTFQADFDVGVTAAATAITAFLVPYALLQFASGTISDMYDRRRTATAGMLLFGIGSFICVVAGNFELFLVARVVQGVGGAFVLPVAMAAIGDSVPRQHMGKAMGFFGAVTTAGVALGPLAGGAAAAWDWRLLFVALTILSAVLAIVLYTSRGTQQSTAAVGKSSRGGILQLLGARNIVFLSLSSFLPFFAMLGALTFTSDYLFDAWQMGEGSIGMILTGAGLAGMFASPLAGWAVDRYGKRAILGIGILVMGGSFLWQASVLNPQVITLGFLVMGVGTAFVFSALGTIAIDMVPSSRGMMSSVYNGFRFAGGALAPVAFSPLYILADISTVYIGAAVCMAASAGLLLLYKTPKKQAKTS